MKPYTLFLALTLLCSLLVGLYCQQSFSGSVSHGGFTGTGTYGGRNNWGVGGSYSNGGHTFGGNYHSSGTVGANYGYSSGNHNFGASVSHGRGGTNVGASYSFKFDDDLLEDDDEFLNWGNINLGCTARCAVYWRCVYANFQDPAAQVSCDKPSGCQCDKFADDDDERFVLPYRPSPTFPTFPRPIMYDDDEKINWKKLGKNVKKGIEIYKQAKEIRDMLRSDDDDERYPIRFPTSSTGPYNPTPTFPRFDDDEKINWKKIGGKVRRGVELYRKYKDLLRPTGDSDDDLKFKIGKLLKKAPRLMSKASDLYKNYQSIRSQANFDDDLDERRMRDTLTKAKKYYRKGRNAYRAIRKLRRALKEKKDAIAAPAVEEVVEEEDDVKTKTSALLKRGLQLYRQIKSNDEAQG